MKTAYFFVAIVILFSCKFSNKNNQSDLNMEENNITENKLIVRHYIENVINTGNVNNISDYISPNYTEVFI